MKVVELKFFEVICDVVSCKGFGKVLDHWHVFTLDWQRPWCDVLATVLIGQVPGFEKIALTAKMVETHCNLLCPLEASLAEERTSSKCLNWEMVCLRKSTYIIDLFAFHKRSLH